MENKECLDYVIAEYSRLIPVDMTMTGYQYANLIGRHYDTRNPGIRYYCYLARRHVTTINRTNKATITIMKGI